jgi:hypothetical protein
MIEYEPGATDQKGGDDPAGGVQVPLSRKEIARYYALAGVILGLSAAMGMLPAITTPGTTQVN